MSRRALAPILLAAALAPGLAAAPFAVRGTLPMGEGPNASLVTPDGRTLVVANGDSGTLTLWDLESDRHRATAPAGEVPVALALSADARTAFAACFRGGTVAFVDLASGRRTHSVDVGVAARDVIRMGETLLVSGYYEGELVAVDIPSASVRARLSLGVGLHRILAHPDGARAFVLDTSRDALFAVRPEPLELVDQLGPELEYQGAWDMVMSPDGSRIGISQWVGDRVAVIDTMPLSVHGFVETGGDGPAPLAFAPDGRTLVVAHSESDEVAVVDADRLHVWTRLPTGRFPFSDVTVTRDGRYALVTADNVRRVDVIDLERLAPAGSVGVGRIPHVITEGPDGRVFVSNTSGRSVSVLGRVGARERAFARLHRAPRRGPPPSAAEDR